MSESPPEPVAAKVRIVARGALKVTVIAVALLVLIIATVAVNFLDEPLSAEAA